MTYFMKYNEIFDETYCVISKKLMSFSFTVLRNCILLIFSEDCINYNAVVVVD